MPAPDSYEAALALAGPDEPTYCHCNRISFGEMIGCDNDDCPIEWFHLACVGLTPETKPKGGSLGGRVGASGLCRAAQRGLCPR